MPGNIKVLLYILMSSMGESDFDKHKTRDISQLIDYLSQHFDLVILNLNKYIFDNISITSLLKSDYYLIPVPATADAVREFEAYFLAAGTVYNIPVDRCRFAAYEYKQNVNFPCSYLKSIFTDNCFLGVISYDPKREAYSNIHSFYAKWIVRKGATEYIDILSKFNIVPRRTMASKLKSWFSRRILLKKKTSNKLRRR